MLKGNYYFFKIRSLASDLFVNPNGLDEIIYLLIIEIFNKIIVLFSLYVFEFIGTVCFVVVYTI